MQPNVKFLVRIGIEKKEGTMEDSQIIDLYWARSEQAVQETDTKYGGYCLSLIHI